ncbi:MAG: T9SS type A sorting domain-containing protein [Bacteroidota bacterium]|jgi:hypothetical protein
MNRIASLILIAVLTTAPAFSRTITATPADYTDYLTTLVAGDTLALAAGTYTRDLTLRDLSGTENDPIVIMGSSPLYTTVFVARSCCNTVSITRCAYVIIKNLELSGGGVEVDAVKGEGTAGNWAHHITLEYLNIVGYGSDQQIVGISTKCHAWNWTIRKNRIIGAGTGLYLGNSDGGKPFVNGLIEYNLVMNTVGYNMEIKHQLVGVRDEFPGTAVNGRTIVRYNVFCKEENASTGGSARPNVLLGAFPASGWGANDVYETYGNFFYQNPVEALLQSTGNLALYGNVFVNHFDPSGFRAVSITSQNGFQPRDVRIFHNTVWAANSSGGMRLYNPDNAYRQYCHANAVFAAQPITNFSDTLDNVADSYAKAALHLLSATPDISTLDLYPRADRLMGTVTSDALFTMFTDAGKDFNGSAYDWRYRGAYSGCCTNPGWKLQLDTMWRAGQGTSAITRPPLPLTVMDIFPNPASALTTLRYTLERRESVRIMLYDIMGRRLRTIFEGDQIQGSHTLSLDTRDLRPGMYCLRMQAGQETAFQRLAIVEACF